MSVRGTTGREDQLAVSVASSDPLMTAMFQPYSYIVFVVLNAALQNGIHDKLGTGPKSLEELVRGTNLIGYKLGITLDTLVRLGIFTREADGRYAHNANSKRLLLDSANYSLIQFMGMREIWDSWGRYAESLTREDSAFCLANGEESFPYIMKHRHIAEPFQEMLHGQSILQSAAVRQAYDFSGAEKVVDIGGGNGKLITDILVDYPRTQGVLFDTPQMVGFMRPGLERSAVARRLAFEHGDFFDSVPSGDVMMLKLVLHDWQDEQAVRILENCRRALPNGGKILVMEHLRTSENLCFWDLLYLTMVAIQLGKERTEEEYRGLLRAAGLAATKVVRASPIGMSVIEAGQA